MTAKSVHGGQLAYPGGTGELGKIRTQGYLSNTAKQSVIGGMVKRIDVGMQCLQTIPCMHMNVSLWVVAGAHTAVIPAGISSGLDIQCIYLLLGSPGWTGLKKGSKYDHFSSFIVTQEDVKRAKTLIRTAVDKWISSLPDTTKKPDATPTLVTDQVAIKIEKISPPTTPKITPASRIEVGPKKTIGKKKKTIGVFKDNLKTAVSGLYNSLK
jgi:hypothetical protein